MNNSTRTVFWLATVGILALLVQAKSNGQMFPFRVTGLFGTRGCVTADQLRVRSGPGTTFAEVGSVTRGECFRFEALREEEGWAQISTGEYAGGWMSVAYLEFPVGLRSEILADQPVPVSPVVPVAESQAAAGESAQDGDASLEAQLLAAINAERRAAGLRPVRLNAKLSAAAQAYAEVVFENSWQSHTGPDGSTPSTRADKAGYSGGGVGEIIAGGYYSTDSVLSAWMASPGHKAAILSGEKTLVGIGISNGYWVVLFGE